MDTGLPEEHFSDVHLIVTKSFHTMIHLPLSLSFPLIQLSPFLVTLTPFFPFQLSSANGYPYRNSSLKRGQTADQSQAVDAFKQNVTQHVNR